ncbi:MAG: hypothetical protein KCHDKBKB_00271 [Elusimicrobia bacterium]|nr:hypothetical protein [Elusimicrobiota bacterium]
MKLIFALLISVGCFITTMFLGTSSSFAQGNASEPDEKWTFAITPYFWLADIGSTLKYDGASGSREADVTVPPEDYVGNIKMIFPFQIEARFGHWSLFSDFNYMKIENEKSRVKSAEFNSGNRIPINASANAGTETTMEMTEWTLLSGYRCLDSKKISFEPTIGLRYFNLSARTDWNLTGAVAGPGPGETFQQSGSVHGSEALWDMLVGFRGQVHLSETKFALPYYFDIGTGESALTWQGSAGLSYAFNWGEISANYRYLDYQTSGSKLIDKLSFSGPSLGVSFQF